ncbi:MAG: pyridoxal-phosphate dependent enzyme [Porticoccaceae bacterium]
MMKKFRVQCVLCRAEPQFPYSPFCPACGGMTEAFFDLSAAELRDSDNPYERYFDLLPVCDRELLPTKAVMTPTIHAGELGEYLGLAQLFLKNETTNPTGTTKYRMAAVSLPYLYESGVSHFCTSSTGNSSTAYAHQITLIPNLKMSLFTGSEFRNRVNYESTSQITHYILHDASFAEAFNVAAEFANEHGHTSERGFFNLGRREGLKLAWLEAVDQVKGPIDWYVQAVSSAMGVYGVYKGAKELFDMGVSAQLPRLMCVQQASCSPMVKAWEEGAETIAKSHIVESPQGIAKAILRGDPSRVYPYMRKIVKESNGTFLAVSEEHIREARTLVMELEGIDICFSAATAVAGVIHQARAGMLDPDTRILINLTGSDRHYDRVPEDVVHVRKEQGSWMFDQA